VVFGSSSTAGAYTTVAYSGASPDSNQRLLSVELTRSGSQTVLAFSRALDNGGITLSARGQNNMIWAVGGSDIIAHHAAAGAFTWVIDQSEESETDGCTASTLAGYACMAEINDKIDLHWAASGDSVSVAVVAETTNYVAFGPSEDAKMAGSEVVIGSSTLQVQPYKLTSQSTSGVQVDSSQTIESASLEEVGGVTTLKYTRQLDNGGNLVISKSGENRMVWAIGPSDSLAHHSSRGVIDWSLAGGVSSVSLVNDYHVAHAVLMLLSWGVAMPLGMLIARFTKHFQATPGKKPFWFTWHIRIQIGSLVVALIAFILALVKLENGIPVTHAHGVLGVVVMALGLFQPLNAALRPAPTADKRVYWNWIHWGTGRGVLVLVVPTIFLGIKRLADKDGSDSLRNGLWGGYGALIALFVGGTVAAHFMTPKKEENGNPTQQVPSPDPTPKPPTDPIPLQPMPPSQQQQPQMQSMQAAQQPTAWAVLQPGAADPQQQQQQPVAAPPSAWPSPPMPQAGLGPNVAPQPFS